MEIVKSEERKNAKKISNEQRMRSKKKMFGQSCASVHSFGFNVVAYLFLRV